MSTLIVHGPARISGTITVPGDKSISHRALMLGAIASGTTTLRDVSRGDDVASTIACLAGYGVMIERKDDTVAIDANGIGSWRQPSAALDCGNSGTTMRLLAGVAAQRDIRSVFDGDTSLRRRPMDRIARPLKRLGARVDTTSGSAPITVEGGSLVGTDVHTGVPSAQVKSCVLFAALGAEGPTQVTEPLPTRDHTERMLAALGASIAEHRAGLGHRVDVDPFRPPAFTLKIPGDASSAAFAVAAGVLAGEVRIEGVGLNPFRIGFFEMLQRMGAAVTWDVDEERMNEPVGTVEASEGAVRAVTIDPTGIPTLHDELPLLAVLATQADGETVVRGAEELRVKESDRIVATVDGLRRLGADVDELSDGFVVRGPTPLKGASIDAVGDHRIAMAFAIAGLVAKGDTRIEGAEYADISWPGFDRVLSGLGAEIETT